MNKNFTQASWDRRCKQCGVVFVSESHFNEHQSRFPNHEIENPFEAHNRKLNALFTNFTKTLPAGSSPSSSSSSSPSQKNWVFKSSTPPSDLFPDTIPRLPQEWRFISSDPQSMKPIYGSDHGIRSPRSPRHSVASASTVSSRKSSIRPVTTSSSISRPMTQDEYPFSPDNPFMLTPIDQLTSPESVFPYSEPRSAGKARLPPFHTLFEPPEGSLERNLERIPSERIPLERNVERMSLEKNMERNMERNERNDRNDRNERSSDQDPQPGRRSSVTKRGSHSRRRSFDFRSRPDSSRGY